MNIIYLDIVDSTNNYIAQNVDILLNNTIVFAIEQKEGRGYGEKKWHSKPNENLTFSILKKFSAKDIKNLFSLNKATALSILNFVKLHTEKFKLDFKIKWPNDIVFENKKIAGILIENKILGDKIASIIGIGININQTSFPQMEVIPTSLSLLTNKKFELNALLKTFWKIFENQFSLLLNNSSTIEENFNKHLYLKNQLSKFYYQNNILEGKIREVDKEGNLIIENTKGENLSFRHNEIRYFY